MQEGNSVFILQSQKLKETIDDIVNQPYEFLKAYKYCRQVDFLLEIKALSNIKNIIQCNQLYYQNNNTISTCDLNGFRNNFQNNKHSLTF